MSIPLPPLPDYGDLANALGASLAMQMCVTEWKDGIDIEVLHRDVDAMLRARDQEIVRCVLEAAAKLFPQPHMEYFGQNIQDALRALEFHHEQHTAA